MDAGSKAELVISATLSCSWYAFSAEMTGEYDDSMKWMRGYGTRLVWNSVTSTFSAPSNRSDAVSDEITWWRASYDVSYECRLSESYYSYHQATRRICEEGGSWQQAFTQLLVILALSLPCTT